MQLWKNSLNFSLTIKQKSSVTNHLNPFWFWCKNILISVFVKNKDFTSDAIFVKCIFVWVESNTVFIHFYPGIYIKPQIIKTVGCVNLSAWAWITLKQSVCLQGCQKVVKVTFTKKNHVIRQTSLNSIKEWIFYEIVRCFFPKKITSQLFSRSNYLFTCF